MEQRWKNLAYTSRAKLFILFSLDKYLNISSVSAWMVLTPSFFFCNQQGINFTKNFPLDTCNVHDSVPVRNKPSSTKIPSGWFSECLCFYLSDHTFLSIFHYILFTIHSVCDLPGRNIFSFLVVGIVILMLHLNDDTLYPAFASIILYVYLAALICYVILLTD